jgi:hypothetical protein
MRRTCRRLRGTDIWRHGARVVVLLVLVELVPIFRSRELFLLSDMTINTRVHNHIVDARAMTYNPLPKALHHW